MSKKKKYKNHVIPNSFQTPNIIVDNIMWLLTDSELRVLLFAIRHILGWREKIKGRKGTISLSTFVKGYGPYPGCGLQKPAIIKALSYLAEVHIMEKDGPVTKDGQRWQLFELMESIDWNSMENRYTEKQKTNAKRTKTIVEIQRKKREQLSCDDTSQVSCDDTGDGKCDDTHINLLSNPPSNPKDLPAKNAGGDSDDEQSIIRTDCMFYDNGCQCEQTGFELLGNCNDCNAYMADSADKPQAATSSGDVSLDNPVTALVLSPQHVMLLEMMSENPIHSSYEPTLDAYKELINVGYMSMSVQSAFKYVYEITSIGIEALRIWKVTPGDAPSSSDGWQQYTHSADQGILYCFDCESTIGSVSAPGGKYYALNEISIQRLCPGCQVKREQTDIEWLEENVPCTTQSCGDDKCHYCGEVEQICKCDSTHCGYTGHDNEPLMQCGDCCGFGMCHTAQSGDELTAEQAALLADLPFTQYSELGRKHDAMVFAGLYTAMLIAGSSVSNVFTLSPKGRAALERYQVQRAKDNTFVCEDCGVTAHVKDDFHYPEFALCGNCIDNHPKYDAPGKAQQECSEPERCETQQTVCAVCQSSVDYAHDCTYVEDVPPSKPKAKKVKAKAKPKKKAHPLYKDMVQAIKDAFNVDDKYAGKSDFSRIGKVANNLLEREAKPFMIGRFYSWCKKEFDSKTLNYEILIKWYARWRAEMGDRVPDELPQKQADQPSKTLTEPTGKIITQEDCIRATAELAEKMSMDVSPFDVDESK